MSDIHTCDGGCHWRYSINGTKSFMRFDNERNLRDYLDYNKGDVVGKTIDIHHVIHAHIQQERIKSNELS